MDLLCFTARTQTQVTCILQGGTTGKGRESGQNKEWQKLAFL